MNKDENRPTSFSWRGPFGFPVLVPHMAIVAIALTAPLDVLDRWLILKKLTEVVRAAMIQIWTGADIENYAASTAFPQVATLTMSMFWLLLPVAAVIHIALVEIGIRKYRWKYWSMDRGGKVCVSFKEVALIVFGAMLFVCAALSVTVLKGDWSLVGGLTTGSRAGMLLIAFPIFYMCSMAVGALYGLLRAFIRFNVQGRT